MRKIYLILLIVLGALRSQAATYTSNAVTGNWSSPSSWAGGVVPGAADDIIIVSGANITTAGLINCANIEISGTLNLTVNSFITSGNLLVKSGGKFFPTTRSFVVGGNFTNNGEVNLSACVMRMTEPAIAGPTTISKGSGGVFVNGVVRNLRIDNPSGVTLTTPLTVSASLELYQGVFANGTMLTVNNYKAGSTATTITVNRQHLGSLGSPIIVAPGALLTLGYSKTLLTPTVADANITAGHEVPADGKFTALTVNNPGGVTFSHDLFLSGATPLTLGGGVVTLAGGKTMTCLSAAFHGVPGNSSSFIDGGLALTAGVDTVDKTFPVGSLGQNRAVKISGLVAVKTETLKTAVVRFAIEAPSGGSHAANVVLSPTRRWKASILAGGIARFTGLSLGYGPDDAVSSSAVIAIAPGISAYYHSLGLGTNTAASIFSPVREYSVLGYFALATGSGTLVRPLTKYSTGAGGPFNSPTSWIGGMVPTRTDTAVVVNAATVTITDSQRQTGPLEISGLLNCSDKVGFSTNGRFLINAGGSFLPVNNNFAVLGDFINNGITNLSTGGTVMRMGTPKNGGTTRIGGTGNYVGITDTGVVRTLRIDNPAGVTLEVDLSLSGGLGLWQGVFHNGGLLHVSNANRASGTLLPVFNIERYPKSSLENAYVFDPTTKVNIVYKRRQDFSLDTLIAGHEINALGRLHSIDVQNIIGVTINEDLTLTSDTVPLRLTSGVIKLATGKTIMCNSPLYLGTTGSIISFVDGALALKVGTTALTRTYPLGSGRQWRKVTVSGLRSSTGIADVRFGVDNVPGGTVGGGQVLFNDVKWHGSLTSGSLGGFTDIAFNYGAYDNINAQTAVLKATSLAGSYTSVGFGSVDGTAVKSPADSYTTLGYFALGGALVTFTDEITSAVLVNDTVKIYQKAEWNIGVSAAFTNPYNDEEIALEMVLTSPSAKVIKLPCFYFAGKGLATSQWKARFAPKETGSYGYKFVLYKNGTGVDSTALATVTVVSSNSDGILHVDPANSWVLKYDSGKAFRGISQNVGWEPLSYEVQTDTYDTFLPLLKSKGVNYVRTFMNNTNLPIEWNYVEMEKRNNKYQNSSEIYHPQGIKRMDELIDMADSLNMHIQFMIEWQGNVREFRDYWAHNPYNKLNGGPAELEKDFFRNPVADKKFKNRLRYMIARWGYSPAVGMWELMNEVDNAVYYTHSDNADVPRQGDSVVIEEEYAANWHKSMAKYLKDKDPYGHIVTAGIGFKAIADMFDIPEVDINQEHLYNKTDSIPARTLRRLTTHGKPIVVGEFARDWQNVVDDRWDDFNFDFKKGLWYGLFNQAPVLPINWWWIHLWNDPINDGFTFFKSVREITDQMLAAGNGSFQKTSIGGLPTLYTAGVKCGQVHFAHVLNNTGGNVTGQPKIGGLDVATQYLVREFDADQFSFQILDTLTSSVGGEIVLPSQSFVSRRQAIYICTPLSLLPVSLMDFNAKAEGKKVKLNWVTASEKDNDRFEIERSSNAKDFEVISRQKGKGTTSLGNGYQVYDYKPQDGVNYYRLKQYDLNGKSTTYDVKAVRYGIVPSGTISANVPEEGRQLNFLIKGYVFTKVEASLYNINGQLTESKLFAVDPSGQYMMPLGQKPATGLYVLHLSDGKISRAVKIFIK